MAGDRPAGYLDLKEAAERIGLHPDSLLRLIRQKQISLKPFSRPAWRARRKYWFQEHAVNQAANARRVLHS